MDTQDEFRAFWSFDPDGSGDVSLAGEKRAFEQLMDFLTDRLERYPEMHVYHYASYEPTALKRLMGRHGTREEQVDRLLRGGVLVDLFRAVRQGLRASVESYSIKKIEALYDFTRQEGLRDAGSSIVEFEEWLAVGGDRPAVVDHPRVDRDVQPRRRAEHAAPAGLARDCSVSASLRPPARRSHDRRSARRTRRSSSARPMRTCRRSPRG